MLRVMMAVALVATAVVVGIDKILFDVELAFVRELDWLTTGKTVEKGTHTEPD